jgi:hypothetical protein
VLRLLFLLLLPTVFAQPQPPPRPPAWNLSAWDHVTQRCAWVEGNVLKMHCTSAGLVQREALPLEGTITVTVEASGGPAPQSKMRDFWIGLALNAAVVEDDSYVQAALAYNIEPYKGYDHPYGVTLHVPANECCELLKPIKAHDGWHTLSVSYRAADGYTRASVDGVETATYAYLVAPPRIELLCVAVDPGTGGTRALADCAFRNLRVEHDIEPAVAYPVP